MPKTSTEIHKSVVLYAVFAAVNLSKGVAKSVGNFNGWLAECGRKISALNGEWQKEADAFLDTVPRKTIETCQRLERQRVDLQNELFSRVPERTELLRQMLPDYISEAARLRADSDRIMAETIQQMRDTGADNGVAAVAGHFAPDAPVRYLPPTDEVLAYAARQQMACMVAAGLANKAETALAELRSDQDAGFRRQSFHPTARHTKRSFRVLRPPALPGDDPREVLSANASAVRTELGLNNAALSPTSVGTIEEIAKLIGAKDLSVPKFTRGGSELVASWAGCRERNASRRRSPAQGAIGAGEPTYLETPARRQSVRYGAGLRDFDEAMTVAPV